MKPNSCTGIPMERQQQLIDAITANPRQSFVFAGFGGAGKTTLMRYQRSLLGPADVGTVFMLASEWQQSITDYACGRFKAGLKPYNADFVKRVPEVVFFLDDVDKLKGSEFCDQEFFSLIDAFNDKPSHCLVMSTNLSEGEFRARFGDSITWRVLKKCTWVEMSRDLLPRHSRG